MLKLPIREPPAQVAAVVEALAGTVGAGPKIGASQIGLAPIAGAKKAAAGGNLADFSGGNLSAVIIEQQDLHAIAVPANRGARAGQFGLMGDQALGGHA